MQRVLTLSVDAGEREHVDAQVDNGEEDCVKAESGPLHQWALLW